MTKRMMALGASLMSAVLVWGAPERPAAFPKVPLLPGSIPYYASVMVDVETNQIGYVMFDGNVSNGYERLYFWVPDAAAFRTPKVFRLNAETRRFGPVEFKSRHDRDEIRIGWSFSAGRGGGAYSHFDYLTGTTRKGTSVINPVFNFQCDYQRQPRSGARPSPSLVDITIPGNLGATAWTNMLKALEPWHTLNYYMTTRLVRDKNHALVRFSGVLNYAHNQAVTVRALPRETVCTLVVAPYQERPVYSNDMAWAEAIGAGVEVKLDYGWYDLEWNMTSPGLRVYPRRDVAVRVSPFPITRFNE